MLGSAYQTRSTINFMDNFRLKHGQYFHQLTRLKNISLCLMNLGCWRRKLREPNLQRCVEGLRGAIQGCQLASICGLQLFGNWSGSCDYSVNGCSLAGWQQCVQAAEKSSLDRGFGFHLVSRLGLRWVNTKCHWRGHWGSVPVGASIMGGKECGASCSCSVNKVFYFFFIESGLSQNRNRWVP